jgi:ubiquitin-protein ligase
MSDEKNLLEKEFEEVQLRFANHPHISLVSTEGTPANKYVVEYRVKGLVRLDDGEIAKSDQHRVEITLSFGFPHFPPNCKPLTQIFHPDIDPSAIKIADFWTSDTTLAALITHIGRMICWQVYSEENAFNQDAANWQASNSASLPLDTVDLAGFSAGGAAAPGAPGADAPGQELAELDLGLSAADLPELAIDAIDLGDTPDLGETPAPAANDFGGMTLDLDFALKDSPAAQLGGGAGGTDVARDLDFGFAASSRSEEHRTGSAEIVVEEIDIAATTPESQAAVDEVEGEVDLDFTSVDIDFDILRGMMDQRNYFAAQKKMGLMTPENLSTAAAELRPEIEENIRAAKKIFQEAADLEEEGLLEEAARKFEGVLNIARDYPELDKRMKRVRNAWIAASSGEAGPVSEFQEVDLGISLDELEGDGEIALGLESGEKGEAPAAGQISSAGLALEESVPPPAVAEEPWSPPGAVPPPAPVKKKVAAVKAPVKKVTSKMPFYFAMTVLFLLVAVSGWVFMEWTSFNKAKEKWTTVHTLLGKGEYEQVNAQCEEIIALLGRVHFVMAADKKELLAQVRDIAESEHLQEALGGKVFYQGRYISTMAHQAYLEIEKFVTAGDKEGAVSNWQGALTSYEAALAVAEKNEKRLDEEFYTQVVLKVKQAQFANHLALGKKAFIAKAWPVAIDNFNKAMELAKIDNVADPSSSHDVNRYLQRALFSQFLVTGDAFLQEKNWKEAVVNYQAASEIAGKDEVVDRASRESVTRKLHQTTLMKGVTEGDIFTSGKKWNQAVAEYEKAAAVLPQGATLPGATAKETRNRVEESLLNALVQRDQEEARAALARKEYGKAIEALQRSVRTIDSSTLKDKAHWQLLKKQAEEDLKRAGLQGIIEEKTAYLLEQYREIFVENFVGVRATALDQPQVKFLEASDSNLIFRVRCRELRDLKYFTLELIYQYNMATNTWGFQGGD